MANEPRVAVYGVRETIAELRGIDPALGREAIKAMKAPVDPLAQTIRGNLSTAALSGLERYWSGGRVTVKYGGRRSGEYRPMVRIQVTGKGQVMADMAGRASAGHTRQGAAMIRNLTARAGRASRFVWAPAEQALPAITDAVIGAAEQVAQQVNTNLVRVP